MSAEPEPGTADDAAPPAPDGTPRIEVVGGGRLSAEEVATLTVAIAAHATAGVGPDPDQTDHAWARAARMEGTGRPRIDRPSHLDQASRSR